MSKPSADTEAETIQQKSVYLRFVQRKKILYSARLIEFTVDSKYSSDHEPLSLEREIIYDWYHANYYRNNSFPRLYRQICTNVYISSFYSNQLTFHRRHPLSK